MSSQEFAQPRRQSEETVETELPQAQVQTNQVDSLLDEIDAVLEPNATAFVQGFVQKGGQ